MNSRCARARIARMSLALALPVVCGVATANPFYNPANGHYYEVVVYDNEADYPTWEEARRASEISSIRGVRGYLATITSQQENDFLIANAAPLRSPRGDLWIGGSDDPVDGEWRWVTGLEAGTLFWRGGVSGTPLGFADWATGSPNDAFGPATESKLGWVEDGWNDLPDWMVRPGFIIEYSDVPAEDPGYLRGPEYSQLQIRPDPIIVGRGGYLVAVTNGISDNPLSPNHRVAAAEYRVAGGPWQPLTPLDGAFGETWETTLGNVGPFFDAGTYEVCARVTFNGGDTTTPSCIAAHVHIPGTTAIVGEGSITAPPVAWPDACLREAIGGGRTGSGAEMQLTVDAHRTDDTINAIEGFVTLRTDAFSLTSDYLYQLFGERGKATLTGSGIIRTSTGCGFDGLNADFTIRVADWPGYVSGTSDQAEVIIRDIVTGATIYDSALGGLEDEPPHSVVTGSFGLTGP